MPVALTDGEIRILLHALAHLATIDDHGLFPDEITLRNKLQAIQDRSAKR